MAKEKSRENPHQWADGTWHSITNAQHLADEATKAAHAVGDAQTQAVFGNWKPGMTVAQAQALANAVPGAPQPAAAAAATPATTPQVRVDPFLTPDDVLARQAWYADIGDKRATGETGLATARTDTAFQNGQLASQAVKATATTQDNMVERGLFQSSIKDGALDDITAQRNTQQGYLTDRLHTAEVDHDAWVAKYGGTLSDGTKVDVGSEVAKFELTWDKKQAENAKAVNDLLPVVTAAPAPAAPAPVVPPSAVKPVTAPATVKPPASSTLPINQASGSGSTATGASGTATNGMGNSDTTGFQSIPGVNGKGVSGTWHVYPTGRRVFVPNGGMTP